MTKKMNKKKVIIISLIIIVSIIILRVVNGVKVIESSLEEKEDLYFRVTLNDEAIYGTVDVSKTYNLIPGFVKVIKSGGVYITFDNDKKYTHNKFKLIKTDDINTLKLNLEVYKCYKNKFVSSNCNKETKYFKKKDIKIDEVEIRRIGITSNKYNELVYKGKFGEDIYSYVKDTDYYSLRFKYKDGTRTYNVDYGFFTNVFQPEVL